MLKKSPPKRLKDPHMFMFADLKSLVVTSSQIESHKT